MMQYHLDYITAFCRTRYLGLKTPALDFSFKSLMNIQTKTALFQEVFKEPLLLYRDIYRKCVEFHLNEIPTVAKVFGMNPTLTTGYVLYDGDPLYKLSTNDLKAYLQGRRRTDLLQLHAWLTLPTMEVVDFTLAYTLADYFISHGSTLGFILGSPSKLKKDNALVYKPMIVGRHFYDKLGVIYQREAINDYVS